MKARFALLLFVLCTAFIVGRCQTSPSGYARKWAVVDSLTDKKGLTQSALSEVGRIYDLAAKEHNEPQLLKALIYQLRLEQSISENGIVAAIGKLEKQLAVSRQPAKSILENILAHLYIGYLQRNRRKLNERTDTEASGDKDIATLSIGALNRKIGGLFLSSLEEEALLAKILVKD